MRALAEHPKRPRGYFLFDPSNQVCSFDDPSYGWSYSGLHVPVPHGFLIPAAGLIARLKKSIGGTLEVGPMSRLLDFEARLVSAFEAYTAEYDPLRLFGRSGNDMKKGLASFGARVADDVLPLQIIDRVNIAVKILAESMHRPFLKRDLPYDKWANWLHLAEEDPLPARDQTSRHIQPYATAALLISEGTIRLGVCGNVEARYNLERLKPLIVGDVVDAETSSTQFCCLVDGRDIGTEEAQWWVPLRQRWLELRRCDYAIAFHEPRMFELIPMEGGVVHLWGADRAEQAK